MTQAVKHDFDGMPADEFYNNRTEWLQSFYGYLNAVHAGTDSYIPERGRHRVKPSSTLVFHEGEWWKWMEADEVWEDSEGFRANWMSPAEDRIVVNTFAEGYLSAEELTAEMGTI